MQLALPIVLVVLIGVNGPVALEPGWRQVTMLGVPSVMWLVCISLVMGWRHRLSALALYTQVLRWWFATPLTKLWYYGVATLLAAASVVTIFQWLTASPASPDYSFIPFLNLVVLMQGVVLAAWWVWFWLGYRLGFTQQHGLAHVGQRLLCVVAALVVHGQCHLLQSPDVLNWSLSQVTLLAMFGYVIVAWMFATHTTATVPPVSAIKMNVLLVGWTTLWVLVALVHDASSTSVMPAGMVAGWVMCVVLIILPMVQWISLERNNAWKRGGKIATI